MIRAARASALRAATADGTRWQQVVVLHHQDRRPAQPGQGQRHREGRAQAPRDEHAGVGPAHDAPDLASVAGESGRGPGPHAQASAQPQRPLPYRHAPQSPSSAASAASAPVRAGERHRPVQAGGGVEEDPLGAAEESRVGDEEGLRRVTCGEAAVDASSGR